MVRQSFRISSIVSYDNLVRLSVNNDDDSDGDDNDDGDGDA